MTRRGLAGSRVTLIGEGCNVFSHHNDTAFLTQLSATNAVTTARYGHPSAASISRQGRLGMRVAG